MRKIGTLRPGTRNEADLIVKDAVLYLVFKATGEWRPASKETCAKHAFPESEAQVAARDRHLDETIREHRAERARMTPEQRAEEIAEMRAAFGPGETVVNIFTGEITKL